MSDASTSDLGGGREAKFLVANWPGGSACVALPARGQLTIGRGQDAGLRVEDESVSRLHAVLHVGATLAIEDRGSRNGTRLSGRELTSSEITPVTLGALIEVGRAALYLSAVPVSSSSGIDDTAGNADEDDELSPAIAAKPQEGIERLRRLVRLVAPNDISVILHGETGVGKEVFAETIHRGSPRAKHPFVAINCAAITEALLESELFGHEKGAFTGAVQRKMGLLESAHGGTVFLDEIGELPLSMQAKLLRALEKREVTPVGSLTPRSFDVRFVAATHRDLDALTATGEFREDLYYRLNGITLKIPPLRERVDEIVPLARLFLEESASRAARPPPHFSVAALRKLEGYAWPGNIRELRNVVFRGLIITEGDEIGPQEIDLPERAAVTSAKGARRADSIASAMMPSTPSGAPGPAFDPQPNTLDEPSREGERQAILAALERTRGNQSKAALMLGLTRRALMYRLRVYGIQPDRKRSGEP